MARGLAALLAALVLLIPFSSAIHFLVVRHGVCPEHGELTHLKAGAPEGHASQGPARLLTALAGAEHSDEHCALSAAPPSPSAPRIAGVAQAAEPLVTPVVLEPARRLAPQPLPLLALAPKASPPVVSQS
ncbi:MAG: hypothetical protein U1E65_21345 [Myxococcota bacterium]